MNTISEFRMTNSAKDVTRAALDDAAALIEYLRARVEAQRHELDTAVIRWGDASVALSLSRELLFLAAAPLYDTTTPEDTIRERVLTEARALLTQAEGR